MARRDLNLDLRAACASDGNCNDSAADWGWHRDRDHFSVCAARGAAALFRGATRFFGIWGAAEFDVRTAGYFFGAFVFGAGAAGEWVAGAGVAAGGYSERVAVCADFSFRAAGAGDRAGFASAVGGADGPSAEVDVAIAAAGAAGEGGAPGGGSGASDTRGIWIGGGANLDPPPCGVAGFGSAGRVGAQGADAIDEGWAGNWSAGGRDYWLVLDRGNYVGAGISGGAIAGDGGPGAVDRRQIAAGARVGGARADGGAGADGGERVA